MADGLDQLAARIAAVGLSDREALTALEERIRRRTARGQPTSLLEQRLEAQLAAAEQLVARRRSAKFEISYPEELPIAQTRAEILEALERHRVIVVCGDTGSGKTTQLPKLCLEAGRGTLGMIGHTQPRRIAAHAVAARLAEELGVEVGGAVGLEVRFTDRCDPATAIKVMTDGILLNEIRRDRYLRAYDTLIIDEAHERSLNIDFILGYLKRIESRRPDLKIIVTSATLDPERFARHFDGAPIIRVEGRSYPVTVEYRPPAADADLADAVVAAARELSERDANPAARDMLVFLPGERWIRDAQLALGRNGPRGYEVLPLYARLPTAGQERIFRPGRAPRIVLATNVAETSLTVPRIGYVIDSGLARVGRYSTRQRVQSLGVEPIARANATQRAGRCGRVAPGVCVRLYSEDDLAARPEFAEPEILRTSLAGVILRLEAWRLGHIDEFPFVDAPPAKAVNDAYQLLHVLGAVDGERRLTADGELMARLPVDPRVARLLVAANRNGSLREALVIAAALSTVDPREQPPDELEPARRAHEKLADPRSDFLTYLIIWQAYRRERRSGERALRAWCKANYLSARRLKEWHDVHNQLHELVLGLGWRAARGPVDYRAVHQPVLAAFVDYVAEHVEATTYRGMRDVHAVLFPGTPLVKKRPRWIVAAERVATERHYLRTVAQINPRWVPHVAPHLVKRHHLEPAWDERRGVTTAREVVTLFGLTLQSEKRVDYGPVDPAEARRLFIRDGLVAAKLGMPPDDRRIAFVEQNRRLRDAVLEAEARLRRRDLFIGESGMAAFYDARLPPDVRDRASLLRWASAAGHARVLVMQREDIMSREPAELSDDGQPLAVRIAGQTLPLEYRFAPGAEDDGVTLRIPRALLPAVRAEDLEWLVPGWLPERALAALRALPKELRRELVPLPDTVRALLPQLLRRARLMPFAMALHEALVEARGVRLPVEALASIEPPAHFAVRVIVMAPDGTELARGRDVRALQQQLAPHGLAAHDAPAAAARWRRQNVAQWDFGELPDGVRVAQRPMDVTLYPALVDEAGRVDLSLLPPGPAAVERHRRGVRRLLLKQLPQQTALIRERTLADRELVLSYHGVGTTDELVEDLLCACADESFVLDPPIRTRAAFEAALEAGRAHVVPAADRLRTLMQKVLPAQRELRRLLAAAYGETATRAANDIRAQLDALISPRLLTDTPIEWRVHLPRYLAAARQRWERLRERPAKDAALEAEVRRAAERLADWVARQPPDWPWPEAVVRYRWLLEELRVSLFAQALGTAAPVSAKRLEEHWRRAQTAGAEEALRRPGAGAHG